MAYWAWEFRIRIFTWECGRNGSGYGAVRELEWEWESVNGNGIMGIETTIPCI